MNRRLTIISLICLIFLFIITYSFVCNRPANNSRIHLEERMTSAESDDAYINFIQQGYLKNGQPLHFFVEDIKGARENIESLINNRRKLVLRYSNTNCNVCIDSAVSEMKTYSNLLGETNMLLLIDDINGGDFQRLATKNSELGIPIYRIVENETHGLIIPSDYPYLFLLDSSLTMKDVFFPIKSKPEYSKMYYETMYEKYFRNM